MKTTEQKKKLDEAWNILHSKALSVDEKIKVKNAFSEYAKSVHPYIKQIYAGGRVSQYQSKFEDLSQYIFNDREEAVLANAIYLNMPKYDSTVFNFILKAILILTKQMK